MHPFRLHCKLDTVRRGRHRCSHAKAILEKLPPHLPAYRAADPTTGHGGTHASSSSLFRSLTQCIVALSTRARSHPFAFLASRKPVSPAPTSLCSFSSSYSLANGLTWRRTPFWSFPPDLLSQHWRATVNLATWAMKPPRQPLHSPPHQRWSTTQQETSSSRTLAITSSAASPQAAPSPPLQEQVVKASRAMAARRPQPNWTPRSASPSHRTTPSTSPTRATIAFAK